MKAARPKLVVDYDLYDLVETEWTVQHSMSLNLSVDVGVSVGVSVGISVSV